jgi:hypothetical protein
VGWVGGLAGWRAQWNRECNKNRLKRESNNNRLKGECNNNRPKGEWNKNRLKWEWKRLAGCLAGWLPLEGPHTQTFEANRPVPSGSSTYTLLEMF